MGVVNGTYYDRRYIQCRYLLMFKYSIKAHPYTIYGHGSKVWLVRGCGLLFQISIIEQTSSSAYEKTKKVGGVNAVLERECVPSQYMLHVYIIWEISCVKYSCKINFVVKHVQMASHVQIFTCFNFILSLDYENILIT